MGTILIVDDQPHLRDLFAQELEEEGYSVASVNNAESAKDYVADSKPDLVLLDLYLNGFEGWDVLHDIKCKDPHLPVFIVTAYDSYVDDPRVLEADGYLVKSFAHLDNLKRNIADVLQRQTAGRA